MGSDLMTTIILLLATPCQLLMPWTNGSKGAFPTDARLHRKGLQTLTGMALFHTTQALPNPCCPLHWAVICVKLS